LRGVTKIAILP